MNWNATVRRSQNQAARLWLGSLLSIVWLVGCTNDDELETVRKLNQRQQQAASSKGSSAQDLDLALQKAQSLLQENQATAAESTLRPWLLVQPDDARLLLLYAKSQYQQAKYEAALATAQRVDSSNRDQYVDAVWLMGQSHEQQGQWHEAIMRFSELLDVPRYQSQTRHRLAALCNALGHRLQAAGYLHQLAERQDLSEKEAFSLICLADPLIERSDGTRPPTPLAIAMQLRADGKYAEALAQLQDKTPAPADAAVWHAFQCRLLAETGDLEELNRAIANAPAPAQQEANYWFAWGVILEASAQVQPAIRCFLESVSRDPTDQQAYIHLARNLALTDEQQVSQQVMQRAELVSQSIRLARRFGARPGTLSEYLELADLLRTLERPWEAIAWQRIAFKLHGSTGEAQQRLQQDLELANKQTLDSLIAARLCGLSLDDWPLRLPDPSKTSSGSLAQSSSLPNPADAAETTSADIAEPFDFSDLASKVGIDFQYDNGDDPQDDSHLLHQMTGGGIAVLDYDLDGWSDLYFGQGGGEAFKSNMPKPNCLYRNLAGKQAADVTTYSTSDDRGYAQGITAADLNQDGFSDLIVANIGPSTILWNNGDGTFRRDAFPTAGASPSWTSSIATGDLSGDGLPELFELNYVDDPQALITPCTPQSDLCNPSAFRAAISRAYTLDSIGTIVPWNDVDWLNNARSYSFAGVIANFDQQAGNDLFIANDADENAYLVSELKPDTANSFFAFDRAVIRGCASGLLGQPQGCMGIAAGDFDHNGYLDLHITNFWNQPSDLYLGDANGVFRNATVGYGLQGLTRQTVGWGTQAIDVDNNGWLDLVILNGHTADHRHRGEPFTMRPQLLRGTAKGFVATAYGDQSKPFWTKATMGRTLAMLDWNRDGRTDLIANHLDQPVALLVNQTVAGNYLQIELVGTTSEREAIGAKVVAQSRGKEYAQWCLGGDGFLCTNDSAIHFGLSNTDQIDELKVTWPSGVSQTFKDVPVNTRYQLVESEAELFLVEGSTQDDGA